MHAIAERRFAIGRMDHPAATRLQHAPYLVHQRNHLGLGEVLEHIERDHHIQVGILRLTQRLHQIALPDTANAQRAAGLYPFATAVHVAGIVITGLLQRVEDRAMAAAEVQDLASLFGGMQVRTNQRRYGRRGARPVIDSGAKASLRPVT